MTRFLSFLVMLSAALLLTACGGSPAGQFASNWHGQCGKVHTYSQSTDINVSADGTMTRTTHYYAHTGCHADKLRSVATTRFTYQLLGTTHTPADPDGHSDSILHLELNVTEADITHSTLDGYYLPDPPEAGDTYTTQAEITDDGCLMLYAHGAVYTKDSASCNKEK